jgi:nitrogen-specific signal transduction histidine kinase
MNAVTGQPQPRSRAHPEFAAIRDTIGIPPEQVENVLEPFEQVADHLTRENQGTGLGLPISRALMELHGGELVLSEITKSPRLSRTDSTCMRPRGSVNLTPLVSKFNITC